MVQGYISFWEQLFRRLLGFDGQFPEKEYSGEEKVMAQKLAYEDLKYYTGQDFGYDVDAWRAWIDQHPNVIQERQERGELPPPDSRYEL